MELWKQFIKNLKKRNRFTPPQIGLAAIGIILSIAIFHALLLPASTVEKETACGYSYEHTHDDSCYEKTLTCGMEETDGGKVLSCNVPVHEHDKSCYDGDKNLICGYADYTIHKHDENCYIDGKLACKFKEAEEHKHGDGCYEMIKTLTCSLPETEGHKHGDSCYEQKLACENEDPEHTHDEFCYEKNLVCKEEETEGHKHNEDCYQTEKVLTCKKPEVEEHIHTQECFDVKDHEHTDSCKNQEGILVCGGLSCKKLEVRKHQHSSSCLKEQEAHKHSESCYERKMTCGREEHVHTEKCYEKFAFTKLTQEVPGADLPVCGKQEHTHDPQTCYKDGEIVCEKEVHIHTADCYVVASDKENGTLENGKVQMPSLYVYENDDMEIHFHVSGDAKMLEADEDGDTERQGTVVYARTEKKEDSVPEIDTDSYEIVENSEPDPADKSVASDDTEDIVPQESEEENLQEQKTKHEEGEGELPSMVVNQLEETDKTYQEISEFTKKEGNVNDGFKLDVLNIAFYQGNTLLDTSDCEIQADIIPKKKVIEPFQEVLEKEDSDGESEAGVSISVFTGTGADIQQTNTEYIQKNSPMPTFSLSLTSGTMALASGETYNPTFTVQYYGYISEYSTSGSNGTITVIDTNNGGNNKGGKLPKNGSGTDSQKKNFYLNSDGTIKCDTKLEELYQAETYEYIKKPNLNYFDKLIDSADYNISEVWILKPGKSAASTAKGDWDVYDPKTIHFTNREGIAGRVQIKGGDVIRLIYEKTSGNLNNAATFYDYNVSDGNYYQAAKTTASKYETEPSDKTTVYMYTNKQGINNANNYSGTGGKLAFGNANIGMGWENETYNGYNLNKSNKGNCMGCIFGLPKTISSDGKNIVFNSGIAAPDLFGTTESGVIGKKIFNGNKGETYSMDFKRNGSTFTLSGIHGTDAQDLDSFEHPATYSIWTNMFWPMDGAEWTGRDARFGASGKVSYRKRFGNGTGSMPANDDNKPNNHNSYFGWTSSVEFSVSDDYIGPLDYLFFGDDDMWIFLQKEDGSDPQLVCDIGGVHSSVGEYVNLWDYIEKGTEGKYKLTFFYTERGASGSSCFMQFTLPSVTTDEPSQNSGSLRIEKDVVGEENSEEEFGFHLTLNGDTEEMVDDYSYIIYDKDNKEVGSGLIIHSGNDFLLKDGQYAIIDYLPEGIKYTVTESDPKSYQVSVSQNNGTEMDANTASGVVSARKQEFVKVLNRELIGLPETGGPGTTFFYVLGSLLVFGSAAALLFRWHLKRKNKK